MRTNLTKPTTFFIIGVARSGTTVLANIFDALEDGFCLGEPHWYEESGREGPGAFGKMAEYYVPPADREGKTILDACVRPALEPGTSWMLGGYKETWHRNNRLQAEHRLQMDARAVDFFIVIFRNPMPTLASLRALGWEHMQPTDVNKDYRRLDLAAQQPHAVVVVLEHLVANPIPYLNRKLPFRIDGPLQMRPTGHVYGDPRANRSSGIEVHDRDVSSWKGAQADLKPAMDIWKRWSNR